MFFKCKKCNKTWQYPIEKCPECFSLLEKIKPGDSKVVGISKVTTPTLLHPSVPYFTLVLEDDKGNRWVQKSSQEYQIGQEFKKDILINEGAVSICRIKYDFREAMEETICLLGGVALDGNSKVLVLPTLEAPTHPYFRDNTSPQFLEAVFEILSDKGVKPENIRTGGQSFGEMPIEDIAQKSQILESCQKFKIMPFDLSKGVFIKKENNGFNFEIADEALKSDLVISLAALKIGKTSASDNILKLLKKENYLGLKYLHTRKEIKDNLAKIMPKILSLGEANSVQKCNKLTTFLGVSLASFKADNLDRVFGEIVSSVPDEIKELKIESIPVSGRTIEELKYEADKF